MDLLAAFVTESNRIEGIEREPGDLQFAREVVATQILLNQKPLTVMDLQAFVTAVTGDLNGANGARLRTVKGLNVMVGNHIPPAGGPWIKEALERLLADAAWGRDAAYRTHLAYETLHPFTDGNGRSGRALWLWQMGGSWPLGFLHEFYYQTLEFQGGRQ